MQNKSTYRGILYKQVYAKQNQHIEVYYINRYMQNKSTCRGILYKQVYAK